jgi:hypothetical protein
MLSKPLYLKISLGIALVTLASVLIPKAAAVNEKVIHNFTIYPHGANPVGNLITDASGNLYGATRAGGMHGYGALFRLTRRLDGKWVQTVLHSFDGSREGIDDAWWPNGGLTLDKSGNLYGTTQFGGNQACTDGCGTVFELMLSADGKWNYSIIYRFAGKNDGDYPNGDLVFDTVGNIYGTAGYSSPGTVFELVRSSKGWTGKTIYNFATDLPLNLAIDAAGKLYGTLWYGRGIFQLNRLRDGKWMENTLCGCGPTGIPVFDQAGNLYVETTNQVLELVRNQKWTEFVIAGFSGRDGNGATGILTFDTSGNLYGTTQYGGKIGSCYNGEGCGITFKLTHKKGYDWRQTVLYRFKENRDGEGPAAGVIFDHAGNLYGTTVYGGDQGCIVNDSNIEGCGTVFELAATSDGHWKHSIINRLGLGDGNGPPSGLIADGSGNLYGTIAQGPGGGCGIVYELTSSANAGWKERILHQFRCGTSDGTMPISSLTLDSAGNLYGTTAEGGSLSSCNGFGCGTVFKLSPSSSGAWRETVLYDFTGKRDGDFPVGGLVFDTVGNLYGTTEIGGGGPCIDDNGYPIGCGIVYELSPITYGKWKETTLHTFAAARTDGAFPAAAPVFDQAGNLYGATTEGGTGSCEDEAGNFGCGIVFKLSLGSGRAWTETVLYNFTGSNGFLLGFPTGGIAADSQGNLYGATNGGGTSTYCLNGCGTVYELSPGSGGGGWTETVLYNFGSSQADGNLPLGTVALDQSGAVYGTTHEGGGSLSCPYGCGTVFQISPTFGGNWTENILHSFGGPYKDGEFPMSGVVLDAAGNIYGTTSQGGADQGEYTGGGTVFEINP